MPHSWPLALYKPPDYYPRIWRCASARKAALAARQRLLLFLSGTNRVLASYEHQHPAVREHMLRLQQQIREIRYGNGMAPDQEGRSFRNISELNVEGEATRADDTRLYECKRYYRTLAQKFHPDKGGDVDYFVSLRNAVTLGDVEYLRLQFYTQFKGMDLDWQAEEGVQFWTDQEERARINRERLQGLPIFKVMSAHVSGNKILAAQLMLEELQRRAAALQEELKYAYNRQRGIVLGAEPVLGTEP